jgi:gliding motility-associated-like protein
MFAGGGGGAGDQNYPNGNTTHGGNGGNGGGIVYLTLYGSVSGTGSIEANGAAGQATNPGMASAGFGQKIGNDAAGGAGGGGAIVISNGTALPATITLSAKGGAGGNQNLSIGQFATPNEADGPGGGGAGGMIRLTSGTAVQTVAGGLGGVTNSTQMTAFPPNGATNGAAGISGLSQPFFDISASNATICSSSSATLTATVTGTLPAGAAVTWYSAQFGGTVLGTGLTFNTGILLNTTTFYVGTCPGTFRKPVVVTVGGPVITGTASITNMTCSTGGSITGLSTSGGAPAVTIAWNGVTTPGMALANASAGTYNVVVTDANGCTASSGPYTIASTGGPTINTTNMIVTNASCAGSSGSISGITTTGTITSVSWNSGAYSTLNIASLTPGNYTLVVTDNNGCTASAGPINVGYTAGPTISTAGMSIVNETCGSGNGSLSGITTTGMVTSVSWNAGAYSTLNISTLSAGSYSLLVTDNLGCTATAGPFTLTNTPGPALSTANMVLVDAHCDNSNGSISGIAINGGAGENSISWNQGAYTTLDISGVPAGTYTLNVTDANGCSVTTGPYTIGNIAGPVISTAAMVVAAESCTGDDGSITGIIAAGSGPLTYQWNFAPTPDADLLNAPSGNYVLVVSDAFGCTTASGPHTITGVVVMTIDTTDLSITDAGCTVNNGAISGLVINGGINPVISWSNSAATAAIANLAPGSYTITVTDDQNCVLTETYTIGTVAGPVISTANAVIGGEHCDQGDGSVTGISVSGGTVPYTYLWDNTPALNAPDLTAADAGNHVLVVTDAVGCTTTTTVAVPAVTGPVPDLSGLLVSIAHCNDSSGSITGNLNITGAGPFLYYWNNVLSPAPNLTAIPAGSYTLMVEDNFGCTATAPPILVSTTPVPTADFNFSPAEPSPGELIVFSDHSTGPSISTWTWHADTVYNAGTASSLSYLFATEGLYPVTLIVSTADGCTDTVTKYIEVQGTLVIPNVLTLNNDGVNDQFVIKSLQANSQLTILNRWGNVVFETDDYKNDWEGSNQAGDPLSEGVYTYRLINAEGKVWQGFVHLLNQ